MWSRGFGLQWRCQGSAYTTVKQPSSAYKTVWPPSSSYKTVEGLCTPCLYYEMGRIPPQCLQNGCGTDSPVSTAVLPATREFRQAGPRKSYANKKLVRCCPVQTPNSSFHEKMPLFVGNSSLIRRLAFSLISPNKRTIASYWKIIGHLKNTSEDGQPIALILVGSPWLVTLLVRKLLMRLR